jgi:hypothetical protein
MTASGKKPWGFWATAAWVVAALVLKDHLFGRFEHLLLNGTAVGRAIDRISCFALWIPR